MRRNMPIIITHEYGNGTNNDTVTLIPIEITIHINWNARNSLLSMLQYNNWLIKIIKVNYFETHYYPNTISLIQYFIKMDYCQVIFSLLAIIQISLQPNHQTFQYFRHKNTQPCKCFRRIFKWKRIVLNFGSKFKN